MGFPKQEFWSGLAFPSPGDLPNPGIEPGFPTLRADALSSEPPGNPLLSSLDDSNSAHQTAYGSSQRPSHSLLENPCLTPYIHLPI